MKILCIALFFIGLYISVQSKLLHIQTEDFYRSLRDDLTHIKSDTNSEQVESITANAFEGLVDIKRSFRPIAYAGIALSFLSLAGLIGVIRRTRRCEP